ncbi:hypothetical protein F4679DRAFT_568202, partial [Xylaria curta]
YTKKLYCFSRQELASSLAAMLTCIAQDRRVCLLSDDICWDCINLRKKSPSSWKDPIVYIHQ